MIIEMSIHDDLPPIPADAPLTESLPPVPTVESQRPKVKKNKSKSSVGGLYVVLGLALLCAPFVLTGIFYYQGQSKVNFKGLDESTKYSLLRVIKTPTQEGVRVKVKKTPGKDSLWLGTNYRLNAAVSIHLISVKKRLLGVNPVELRGETSLHRGVALFNSFKMIRGLKLTSGEYEYTITMKPKDDKLPFVLWLNSLIGQKLYQQELAEKKFSGKVIFYSKGIREFEKRLKAYHIAVEKKYKHPLDEKLSRYDTFRSLLVKCFEHYKSVMDEINKGKDITKFEDLYNNDVGPFLRDLIIDANRQHLSFLNLDPEQSSDYEELFNVGKEIGGFASDLVVETRKHKKLTKKVRGRLLEKFNSDYNSMMEKIQNKVNFYDKKLDHYTKGQESR